MSIADGIFVTPPPLNEPVRDYAPGSPERAALLAEVARQSAEVVEIPCVVGGERVFSGRVYEVTMPCEHRHVLARVHLATPELIASAIERGREARARWAGLPWHERAAVFLRAAELLAGPWRDRINASTMVGQAKTMHQAEIDSACELIDFWRFNVHYARQIMSEQPQSPRGVWNRMEHRPLEGFVLAITPFNFTSIALNLPTAPVLMGNVCLWKPAHTQMLSAWYGMLLLEEAGLPPGVVSMLPGFGAEISEIAIPHADLAGIHFTGSTPTFRSLWRAVANNLERYRGWPRLVGETGGKDFIVAHPSADLDALAVAIARGGYEYQGQKCSAASRVYIPQSLWPALSERVAGILGEMKMGDVRDPSNFVGAVIDQRAWTKHREYLGVAHKSGRVLCGGSADDAVGWYVQPTFVQVEDPHHQLMEEEIFGPIVTAFVYPDAHWTETLQLVDQTSPYALTGAVFARDRLALAEADTALKNAAGNYYINDKPTGAVVGQQPFGGARASGTNDKAGSVLNLLRWVSPRTMKETFTPPRAWRYPFLG